MVVQHNLTAMNSNRLLGLTTASQAKSTEKLSSGYKINRAADDASGLSISEKMRKQIRGLTQASTNAQDGISAVQTAEGALAEVHDMLQRMNELAVKSANGTNSEDDRQNIQDEISQLVEEIDRVAETTKFNETYLLKGDITAGPVDELKYAGGTLNGSTKLTEATATKAGTVYTSDGNPIADEAGVIAAKEAGKEIYSTAPTKIVVPSTGSVNGMTTVSGKVTTGTVDSDIYDANGKKLATKLDVLTSDQIVAINKAIDDGGIFSDAGTVATPGAATYEYTAATYEQVAPQLYDIDGNKIAANGLQNYIEFDASGVPVLKADKDLYTDDKGTKLAAADLSTYVTKSTTAKAALNIDLHVGADATSNNQIGVKLEAMSAKGIGIDQLKVTGKKDDNSLDAIDTIKAAIQRVSGQRSLLGAAQNRLEHTITNLDNIVENTTAAESQIRDTDMATEMVKYSNNNILAQAGQSMLAQANQGNQGVLSLLG